MLMMIASGIFCIDESLWKFVCKQKGSDSENAKVVRAIPRKPAKIGLLSYELSGFLTRSNKPYTFGIIPMTHRQHCTPTEAADYLMKPYNSHKPGGSPQPFVIMDSAFSSEACLKLAQENGWLFSVSVNSQIYSSLSTAIRAGLQSFEYRMFQTSDGLVMTAYNSQFEPSSKKNRGSKKETQLEVLNLTSALRFRQTLISDLTPMTGSSKTEVSFFGKTYSRDQLARLPVDSCKSLLKQLGFTGIRSLRKKECVDLLLEIRNEEHLSDIARTMLSKKTRPRKVSLETELPHLSIYRKHFASLDRVDVFLSCVDSEIRHRSFRTRFLERIMFLFFNNVRVYLCEGNLRLNDAPYQRGRACDFLDDLFIVFDSLAEAPDGILL